MAPFSHGLDRECGRPSTAAPRLPAHRLPGAGSLWSREPVGRPVGRPQRQSHIRQLDEHASASVGGPGAAGGAARAVVLVVPSGGLRVKQSELVGVLSV